MLGDNHIGAQEVGLIIEVAKGAMVINSLQCRHAENGMPLHLRWPNTQSPQADSPDGID